MICMNDNINDKFFIDSNIIVYAHDETEKRKKEIAQDLIFKGIRSQHGTISAQVISEFYVTITQKVKKPLTTAHARHELMLLSYLDVIDVDFELAIRATHLKEEVSINYWDGLIVAAAERAGCTVLYSEDLSHGQRYGTVTVEDPFR